MYVEQGDKSVELRGPSFGSADLVWMVEASESATSLGVVPGSTVYFRGWNLTAEMGDAVSTWPKQCMGFDGSLGPTRQETMFQLHSDSSRSRAQRAGLQLGVGVEGTVGVRMLGVVSVSSSRLRWTSAGSLRADSGESVRWD